MNASDVDLRALTDAIRVLCSPLAYASPASWRVAAHVAVSRVIGHELAHFVFPETGKLSGEGMSRLSTVTRPSHGDWQPAVEEHRNILDALVPAHHAGLSTVLQLDRARAALLSQLEATSTPAVLFDTEGEEVHRTAPVADLLGSEAPAVLEAMQELSRRVGAQARRRSMSATRRYRTRAVAERPGAVPTPVTTRVGNRRYALTPTVHPDLLGWRGSAVVIVVQGARDSASDEVLRDRHGLTPREVEVARALSTGAAIADIAERLGVSVHTVRRHSEQVYRKLGVNTRREAAEWLNGAVVDS